MQSTESKTKRSRKSAEEKPAAQAAATPVPAIEETAKPKRRTSVTKAVASDTTTAVKQHRGAARKTAVAEPATTPVKPAVTHQQIAELAYSFWVERGYQDGFHEEDWHRAVRQLTA